MCKRTFTRTDHTLRHLRERRCDRICDAGESKNSGHIHNLIFEEFDSFDAGLNFMFSKMYDSSHVVRQSRTDPEKYGKEILMVRMICEYLLL